jgi:hypothetical protein
VRLDADPVLVTVPDVVVVAGACVVDDPVDDEPPVEVTLLVLPVDVVCEGGALVGDAGGLLNGAFTLVFVVAGAGVLGADVVGAAVGPADFELGLAQAVEDVSVFAAEEALLGGSEGDEVVLVALALGLPLVGVPPLGLGLPVPVVGLVGVTSGVGDGLDELGEAAGLDVFVAGVDELGFAAADVAEPEVAGPAGVQDVAAAAGAVLGAAEVAAKVPLPPAEEWPAATRSDELGVGLAVGLDPIRLANADCAVWRSGGTAASRTPTANTLMPTARAGRSIASRQSLGRCGARRECLPAVPCAAGEPRSPRIPFQRPARLARNAAIARRKAASRDCPARAWAGRDRIFSRIRSRPSGLGSS